MDTFWSLYEGFNNFLKDWGIWTVIIVLGSWYVLQKMLKEPSKRIKEYEQGKKDMKNDFFKNIDLNTNLDKDGFRILTKEEEFTLNDRLKKHKEEFVLISLGSIWGLLILIASLLSIIMFILIFNLGSN